MTAHGITNLSYAVKRWPVTQGRAAFIREWAQVSVDERLTAALLDRLDHTAHAPTTKGRSHRTKRATDGSSTLEPDIP